MHVTIIEDGKVAIFEDDDKDTEATVRIPVSGLANDVYAFVVKHLASEVVDLKPEDHDLYDMYFVDKNGEKKQIKESADVTIPVTREVEHVYHVSETDKRTLEEVPFTMNEEKTSVTFHVEHFSHYAIAYKPIPKDESSTTTTTTTTATMTSTSSTTEMTTETTTQTNTETTSSQVSATQTEKVTTTTQKRPSENADAESSVRQEKPRISISIRHTTASDKESPSQQGEKPVGKHLPNTGDASTSMITIGLIGTIVGTVMSIVSKKRKAE
ncbi:LPXTG cell wall anchor domain-containing protein [Granulicatella sp. zg-ZJ]|uniref:LPXTG cell wall anchor domain-containing protein n=1 Tax=Granulicatella sp. zg-ZJ TaxID=2678504 RepID=UPI0013D3C3BC